MSYLSCDDNVAHINLQCILMSEMMLFCTLGKLNEGKISLDLCKTPHMRCDISTVYVTQTCTVHVNYEHICAYVIGGNYEESYSEYA